MALSFGFWGLGSGLWDLGLGLWALGSGRWALGSGLCVLGSGFWALGSGRLWACAGLARAKRWNVRARRYSALVLTFIRRKHKRGTYKQSGLALPRYGDMSSSRCQPLSPLHHVIGCVIGGAWGRASGCGRLGLGGCLGLCGCRSLGLRFGMRFRLGVGPERRRV